MEQTPFSDTDIITKVIAGESGLYEILIRRYNPFLYRTGRAFNYCHDDTQDLMQESFIDAYLNLPKFEHRASFKTWITKIMLNKCWRRRQKLSVKNEVRQQLSDQSTPLFSSSTDTQHTVMNKELSRVIEKSLAEIPENYRMVFALREVNGFSVAETAEALAISEANVKVRLNRAKAMLRTAIEKSYSKEEIFEFNLIYCDAIVANVMSRIQLLQAVHIVIDDAIS
jgi:RNA polymerase sigma factor (sigma-70 family)